MQLFDTLLLFVAMLGLAALPSTSVALIVSRSATAGFRHGALVAAGIVLGDLVFVCLAVLGMAVVAQLLGDLFVIVRYLAGVLLICLGLSMMFRGKKRTRGVDPPAEASFTLSFLSGLLLTMSDVKAILFYASLFPAFVDLQSLKPTDVALIAVLTVVAVGGVKLGYAWAASRFELTSCWRRPARGGSLLAGGTMAGAGAWLLTRT